MSESVTESGTRPKERTNVEDRHFEAADELLSALSATAGLFKKDPLDWIYRGQANAEWRLLAKLNRSPEQQFARFGITMVESTGYGGTMRDMLRDFGRRLGAAGIAIPLPDPSFGPRKASQDVWRGLMPLTALAQHHGLPTFLLDWSRRGPVAAYFAASSALDPNTKDRGSHLAVWALYCSQHEQRIDDAPELSVYSAPASTNPNLRAQSGLFTLPSKLGEDNPCIEMHVARLRSAIGFQRPLVRMTLPHSEAPRLLRLLSLEGIDGATMFPGADGVVLAMHERTLWDSP